MQTKLQMHGAMSFSALEKFYHELVMSDRDAEAAEVVDMIRRIREITLADTSSHKKPT